MTLCVALATLLPLGACEDRSLPEVYPFAERLDIGDYRQDILGHDFDGAEPQRRVAGWSHTESAGEDVSFVWAVGREAELVLDVDETEGLEWLHFRCWPADFGLGRRQYVRVGLNGTELGVVELNPVAETYSLALPGGVVATGENTLSLVFSLAERPSAEDSRPVAAAFDFVALSPTSEVPPLGSEQSARSPEVDGSDFVLPGSSSLAFSFTVPRDGAVEFGAALEGEGESVSRAELMVRGGDAPETILWSGRSTGSRRVDLSDLAGQAVDLVFRARGDHRGAVRWSSARLLGDVGETNLTTNVLFVVVDTLRADHIGAYGGDLQTPHIDALAASGVRFANAYSPIPITGPSHSSMFTSLMPSAHGVRNNLQPLADSHVTLAELLRASYRRTAGFVSLGVIRAPSGLNQGFDEYHDAFGLDWWTTAEEMNDRLVPWIEQVQAPYFLWAHYSDPHEPYAPPGRTYPLVSVRAPGLHDVVISAESRSVSIPLAIPPGDTDVELTSAGERDARPIRVRDLRVRDGVVEVTCARGCEGPEDGSGGAAATITLHNDGESDADIHLRFRLDELPLGLAEVRDHYREEVEYADRWIGDLIAAVTGAGHRDDTLIILTADHGEGLGDHDYLGHAGQLYEEQLRVPLIVSWPGGLPSGQTVEAPVSLIDVLPTITDLLSIRDDSVRSGRSLVPVIERDTGSASSVRILAETFRPQSTHDRRALIADGVKLILGADEEDTMLFDLTTDPEEAENRSQEWPARVSELHQVLVDHLEGGPQGATDDPELTDEQLRRLRSLGYVR